MSHSQPFSISHNNPEADDSSTVFDADTVVPDEVPSLPPARASQEESPQSFTSVLLRRINSRHRPAEPSTTTATATRSEEIEISTNESSSSSSKKRLIITNSFVKRKQLQENSTSTTTKKSSAKRPRRSSRLKRQPQDQSCVDKSDSEVENENGLEDENELVTKNELKWRSKFQELRAYKRSNGDVNVPKSNKQLGIWVNTQRHEYRKLKDNKHSCMTNERIEKLESIDFEWVSPNKGSPRNEYLWNERFNELEEYKKNNGHTNVSTHDEDNKQLGKWVSNQRTAYKKFKENKKTFLTPERIEILNSIGFEWVCPKNESEWNKRFTELKCYKEKYGRTNVPKRWKDNKQLGRWVNTQRTEYKKFQENRKGKITLERIGMLDSIGFQWSCRPDCAPRS